MGRLLRRLGLFLLVLLLALAAFVAVQFQRRPSLEPYRALTLPAAGPGEPVRVRFGGVATLLFDDGETAWMTDGFFSRPPAGQVLAGRIGPDTARIEAALKQMGVTRLAAVVPVHSHYDHAMDAPLVAQRTGALLVGGRSTMFIGRGLKLADARMREVKAGETLQLGKFSLRFVASRHSPTPYSDGHTREDLAAPLVPPQRATAWAEGDVWSIFVSHASGRRFLVQGSAGIVPGALGEQVDTVFLGTGTLGMKDSAYRQAYWDETVKATGAKRVIPIHYDDFTRPLEEGLVATPYLIDDFSVVMADLEQRSKAAGVELRMPPLFTPFAP
jgi:L-ascorbate metabolism protein UlaG (beta-lactamase superfamily)